MELADALAGTMQDSPPPDAWIEAGRQRSCGRQDRPARARVGPARPSAGRPKDSEGGPTVLGRAGATVRRWHDSTTNAHPRRVPPGNRTPRLPWALPCVSDCEHLCVSSLSLVPAFTIPRGTLRRVPA